MNVRGRIRLLSVSAIVLCFCVALHFWAPAVLQRFQPARVIGLLEDYVARYGAIAVFIGAFVEGLLLVSWYTPGSSIVLVAAMLAGRGVIGLPSVIVSASAGFTIGYAVSYALGWYGWAGVAKYVGLGDALGRMQVRVTTAPASAFILLFAHPHCGVLAATAAGILKKRPGAVLPLLAASASLWTTVWAITAFSFGRWVLEILNGPALAVVVIGLLLYLVLRNPQARAPKTDFTLRRRQVGHQHRDKTPTKHAVL